MNAKEYLIQLRHLNAQVTARMDRIKQLREMAARRDSLVSDAPRGTQSDRRDIVAGIVDEIKVLGREIDRLLSLQGEIQRAISGVDDTTLRTLLELRYLTGLTWEQVAETMHYDISWVYPLHTKALKIIEKVRTS